MEKMVKEVGFGCQIISVRFMILLDYLFIFKEDWLDGSGGTYLLKLSAMVTSGKANAMLVGSSSIMLCRYLHQVNACSLYLLHKEAYEQYSNNSNLIEPDWVKGCEESYLMFKYWNQTSNLQLILLQFGKAVRSGDFQAYLTVLTVISP